MMKRLLFHACSLIMILFHCKSHVHAQRDWTWAFGDSVLMRFPGGWSAIIDTNERTGRFFELGACISDSNGDFLFYANQEGAFDTLGSEIPGGQFFYTDATFTNGLIIIPTYREVETLYMFYISFSCGGSSSCVQNAVIKLSTPQSITNLMPLGQYRPNWFISEKLSAVRTADGRGWWVLGHGGDDNAFIRYNVNQDDLVSPLDTQQIGTIHGSAFGNSFYTMGEMCFSPQGDKLLAVAVSGIVDVFDFDRCNGQLSNWIPYGTEAFSFPGPNTYYGCSFSPDGSKIYASEGETANGNTRLYQWDLTAQDIPASKKLIFTTPDSIHFFQHQLGPDGMIYITQIKAKYDMMGGYEKMSALSVITSPDSAGLACGFQYLGLPLGRKATTLHLPNLPNYNLGPLLAQTAEAGPAEIVLCLGDSVTLGYPDTTGARVKYLWDGPGVAGDTTAQVTVSPAAPGAMYRLQAFDPFYPDCGLTKDSVWVRPARPEEMPTASAGTDTTVCAGDTVELGVPGGDSEFVHVWSGPGWISQPDSSSSYSLGEGMYVLEVSNPEFQGWCFVDSDTAVVAWHPAPVLPQGGFAGADALLCAGDTVLLGTVLPAGWSVVWSPQGDLADAGAAVTEAWPVAGETYVIQIEDSVSGGLCFSVSDTVQVLVEQPFTHAVPPPLVRLCPGGCVEIGVVGQAGMRYEWSPTAGLDNPLASLTVARPTATTVYTLTVTDTLLQSADCRELRFEVVAEVEDCARQTMLQSGVGVLDLGPHAGVTELTVWDAQGRLVWFDGDYVNDWRGAGMARGVYVYRVRRLGFEGLSRRDGCDAEWVSKLVIW